MTRSHLEANQTESHEFIKYTSSSRKLVGITILQRGKNTEAMDLHPECWDCVMNIKNSLHSYLLLARKGTESFGKREGNVHYYFLFLLLLCPFFVLASNYAR